MIKFLPFFLLLFIGCSTQVESDHSNQRHSIKCMDLVARCHDRARDICTDGYLVTNRVRPQRVEGGTEFTVKIRCRSGNLF